MEGTPPRRVRVRCRGGGLLPALWALLSLRPLPETASGGWRGRLKNLGGTSSLHTRLRNAHVVRMLLGEPPVGEALEVGFGDGSLLRFLSAWCPEAFWTAVEADHRHLERARRWAGSTSGVCILKEADWAAQAGKTYHLILSVDVLEHVSDDAGLVRTLAGRLRPGGRLLLHVPRNRHEQRRIFPRFSRHTDPGHVREEYRSGELVHLVEQAGLEVVCLRHTFGFWGELAFELNAFFWQNPRRDPWHRRLTVFPLLLMALPDLLSRGRKGNSLLLLARKPGGNP